MKPFTFEKRKYIRDRLALNWAGGYSFAFHDGVLVERIQRPSCAMFVGRHASFQPAPPTEYRVIFGETANAEVSFKSGRRICFFGKIRSSLSPKRMLGEDPI